jgi:multicomponent Na+:H+ antiporter subunit D
MPITGLTTTIGTFSIAGVPPFNGFWSKFFVILALVEAHMYWIATLAVATSILTLAYFLIIQRRAFFGKLAVGLESLREVPISMTFATMSLATLCLVAGLFYPWITDHLIQPGVASLTQAVGTSASMLTGP